MHSVIIRKDVVEGLQEKVQILLDGGKVEIGVFEGEMPGGIREKVG